MSFDISYGFLPENNYDMSDICQGSITKYLFKEIINHFSKKQLSVYGVYIPSVKKSDLFDFVWVDPNKLQEPIIEATEIVSVKIQKEIFDSESFNNHASIPPMIFTNAIDTSDGIYCYAVGTNDMKKYINEESTGPIEIFDIEEEFGVENIMTIKIG